jgi:hypothetical protein
MKKVIVINGSGGSGKDTFVDLCREQAACPVINLSTVDSIKQVAVSHFGWDGNKDEKGRQLLSDLKDAWTKYCQGPFFEMTGIVERFKAGLIFLHVREPEEIGHFKAFYGPTCTTLLIQRDIDVPDNHADRLVACYDYDTVIHNNGTIDSLRCKAADCVRDWTDAS